VRWCLSHRKSGSPRNVLLLLLVLGDCADAAVARIQDTWQISTIHISLHRLAETRLVAARACLQLPCRQDACAKLETSYCRLIVFRQSYEEILIMPDGVAGCLLVTGSSAAAAGLMASVCYWRRFIALAWPSDTK